MNIFEEEKAEDIVTKQECNYECPPPPGWDDYFEPAEGFETPSYSYNEEYYAKAGANKYQNDIKYDNIQTNEATVDTEWTWPTVVLKTCEPSHRLVDEIYASFILTPYTDMVNTNLVTGVFDSGKKTLKVTFFNPKDYSVFVELLKKKKSGLFSFLEKPKSIFMDVHERHGDKEKIYHFEFAGCRLKRLLDTKYAPKDEYDVLNTVSHECTAIFKYKKLKLT